MIELGEKGSSPKSGTFKNGGKLHSEIEESEGSRLTKVFLYSLVKSREKKK